MGLQVVNLGEEGLILREQIGEICVLLECTQLVEVHILKGGLFLLVIVVDERTYPLYLWLL